MELKNPQKFLIRLKQDLIPLASVSLPVSDTVSVKGTSVHSERINILQNGFLKGLIYLTINSVTFWTAFVKNKRQIGCVHFKKQTCSVKNRF